MLNSFLKDKKQLIFCGPPGALRVVGGGGFSLVEVDAGVGAGGGFDLGAEFEVPEIGVFDGAVVVEVSLQALEADGAVLDGEGFLFAGDVPAVEGFAVEEGHGLWFGLRGGGGA